jgi:hypothetical protein
MARFEILLLRRSILNDSKVSAAMDDVLSSSYLPGWLPFDYHCRV